MEIYKKSNEVIAKFRNLEAECKRREADLVERIWILVGITIAFILGLFVVVSCGPSDADISKTIESFFTRNKCTVKFTAPPGIRGGEEIETELDIEVKNCREKK